MKSVKMYIDVSEAKDLYRLLGQQLRERGDKGERWRLEFHSDGRIEVWSGRFGLSSEDAESLPAPPDPEKERTK